MTVQFPKGLVLAILHYYKTMFDTKSNTVKQLWNNLYKVCNFKEGKSKNTKYTVPILKINNDNISDPQSICNEFANSYNTSYI